jgi:hypothetical protein
LEIVEAFFDPVYSFSVFLCEDEADWDLQETELLR